MADAANGSEREELVETLNKHRGFLRYTVRGLTDSRASRCTTVSQLCLGGLIKHVTRVEQRWAAFIETGPSVFGSFDRAAADQHAASFKMEPGGTLFGLLEEYEEVARRTDTLIRQIASLDAGHTLPDAPWFERDKQWSARRVVLHILAETAQHAGHADIVRESLDGSRTMG
jgi:Protein of unknown function (DUF664)